MIFGNMVSCKASYEPGLYGLLAALLTTRLRTMASGHRLPEQGVYAKRLFVKVHAVRKNSEADALPTREKHTGRRMSN